ncbi:MAG: hypothetical protein U1E16_07575 [Hyphomicrobiales bacterium]
MHDFGKIVYLDLQKTGSSFVSQFLRAACVHPERRLKKHVWIEDDYREDSIYFITVREPLMLYSSLYRFGLDQRGGIFNRLRDAGHLSVYDSFQSFTAFLLDPANASLLHPRYVRPVADEMGFMSFRFLLLNLQCPVAKIRRSVDEGQPVSRLMSQSIVSHVLKNETLNDDLLRLATKLLPQHFDAGKAEAFLATAPRVNQSKTASEALRPETSKLREAVAARESLIMVHYR